MATVATGQDPKGQVESRRARRRQGGMSRVVLGVGSERGGSIYVWGEEVGVENRLWDGGSQCNVDGLGKICWNNAWQKARAEEDLR